MSRHFSCFLAATAVLCLNGLVVKSTYFDRATGRDVSTGWHLRTREPEENLHPDRYAWLVDKTLLFAETFSRGNDENSRLRMQVQFHLDMIGMSDLPEEAMRFFLTAYTFLLIHHFDEEALAYGELFVGTRLTRTGLSRDGPVLLSLTP